MAFRRKAAAPDLPRGETLDAALSAIGMNLAAPTHPPSEASGAPVEPNIEDVLLAASIEGLERDDLRLLAVLMTWLRVHHRWINADRLHRAVLAEQRPRVRAFWAAAGAWLTQDFKDRRFACLVTAYREPRLDLLGPGTEFHISRSGEDARFAGSPLRVPANVLRDRDADVLPPEVLAALRRGYLQRVQSAAGT